MSHFSLFPVIENLLKEEIALYSFVPPKVQPPYVIYQDIDQTWSFPEKTTGTLTFSLKGVSTYKGSQEINQIITFLKQKLEGVEMRLNPQGKGVCRLIEQEGDLKKDTVTREAVLTFQVRVKMVKT